jgi:hypothetical protein
MIAGPQKVLALATDINIDESKSIVIAQEEGSASIIQPSKSIVNSSRNYFVSNSIQIIIELAYQRRKFGQLLTTFRRQSTFSVSLRHAVWHTEPFS